MTENQSCPKCDSKNVYQDAALWVCPECFHEWTKESEADGGGDVAVASGRPPFLDANGVQLESGDTVITVKDLKVGSDTLKAGTKVKGIRLLDEPVDDHDISCKVAGFGFMYLKCSVVKKAK